MKKALFVLLVLIILLNFSPVSGDTSNIFIDGDLADWNGINPIIIDEAINESHFLDVGAVYMTANETNLFYRMDFDVTPQHWASLMTNITIRIPNQTVFVLLSQILFEEVPHWSFTGIFRGIDILSPYNNKSLIEHDVFYDNSVAIDSTTNQSIEFYYKLADLGLIINDSIDITVWHYDSLIVGDQVFQGIPILANTVYGVKVTGKVENNSESTTSSASPTTPTATTTTVTSTVTSTTINNSTFGFSIGSSLILLVISPWRLRKRKNKN